MAGIFILLYTHMFLSLARHQVFQKDQASFSYHDTSSSGLEEDWEAHLKVKSEVDCLQRGRKSKRSECENWGTVEEVVRKGTTLPTDSVCEKAFENCA